MLIETATEERGLLDSNEISRALARISHEILERNGGVDGVVLVGIHTRGVPIAKRIAGFVMEFEGTALPVGSLDIGLYRDDVGRGGRRRMLPTDIPFEIEGRHVVLVDDVLYKGRTVRAAMDALNDFGRPLMIQLAVLIDRGHRELPIRPDYVGKNVPTSHDEQIRVRTNETDGFDEVVLVRSEQK